MHINNFVKYKNKQKKLFTAGPASLLPENIYGLMPCFGRGDEDYLILEDRVLNKLKEMSGHSQIVRLQGSASLALEIMSLNFLYGNVLVVDSGYYSDRLFYLAENASKTFKYVTKVDRISWQSIGAVTNKYDWILSCYVETSMGIKIPLENLKQVAENIGAKLMLDATASIGLEKNHQLADAIAFSSCKGLFGLTGASFISFNNLPINQITSFYLNINNHINKMMTGPYHSIASLDEVLKNHTSILSSVITNKAKFIKLNNKYLTVDENNQPLICTHVNRSIFSRDPAVVLYKPRNNLSGSVVCHLGEAHLKEKSKGKIISSLEFE